MKRILLTTLCCAILLGGCSPGGRTRICHATPHPLVAKHMADAFDPHSPDRRRGGLLALSRLPGGLEEPYLAAYATLADDPDPLVRCTAIETLARAGDANYLDVVLNALDDGELIVRISAVDALDLLHGEAAVEPLLARAARDGEADIRLRAVRALRHYRTQRVLDTLLRALDDPAYGVRYTALQSLRELTGRDEGYDIARWRRTLAAEDDPFVRAEPDRRRWWRLW